jgi:hypothetical protein
MAGIPLYTASPINTNAAKATGITPTTTQPSDTTNRSAPAYTPATTTASSSYPQARPGAAAYPAPTGAPQSTNTYPTRTAPPAPTQQSNAPSPPQPGAVPSPFISSVSPITRARRPSIPPPPKAGEIPQPVALYNPHYEQEQQPQQSPYSPQSRAPPPQMSAVLSTPTRAIPPASTTSTPAYADLSHPPGYIQNSRDSFDQRPEHMQSPYQNQNQNYGNNTPNRSGLLGSGGGNMESAEESPIAQIWNTATSWAKTAGEKLKEGEEEVWRRINK